jgi:UDP-2,3-diacylglucosamine pyrophosphatase LpxH
MIVVISDLHLQHTSCDSVRYANGGEVWESGVRRNVVAGAFRRFARMVDQAARDHTPAAGGMEVHLVFAGDIFELHRTPLWFMGEDNGLRPYETTRRGSRRDGALRDKVCGILACIEADSSEFWQAVRAFVEGGDGGSRPYRVVPYYIPGNHDRLLNRWPETRRTVRRLLGFPAQRAGGRLTWPDDRFPNYLDFPAHRVRVRHGHEYEASGENAGFEPSARNLSSAGYSDYLRPCLGDYVTIDFAARLAIAFRARHAVALRDPRRVRMRRLYEILTEFDDVRPMSKVFQYMDDRLGELDDSLLEALAPVLRDTTEAAAADGFFKGELRRVKRLKGYVSCPALTAASLLPESFVAPLFRRSLGAVLGGRDTGPSELAQHEEGLGRTFDVVIAGHTHAPAQVPLPEPPGQGDCFYVDTGTWRTAIPEGTREAFGRLRAYSMAFAYNDAERAAPEADGRRFETWTGHLAWEPTGQDSGGGAGGSWPDAAGRALPYDLRVPEVRAGKGTMQLRFLKLEARRVQRELGGAELLLHLGVDGTETSEPVEARGISSGGARDIECGPVALDPALDGEVWAHGKELDPLKDDLLPWGLARIRRDGATGEFLAGNDEMHLRARDGTHIVIRYTVEPRA